MKSDYLRPENLITRIPAKSEKKGVCTGNYGTNRERLRDIPARINQNARLKLCRTLLFCFFSQSMIDND